MTALILRRANVSRISGRWQNGDYDVFDGDHDVGRIYLVDLNAGTETWFWGKNPAAPGVTRFLEDGI
jgi:hypothetical protein